MNKDVIYIDVEDDITAIIGKVKDAKEKIVALVPPKRVGILQSAVNLRLLKRAAAQENKRLVLISSNSALSALAAAAQLPVAKNLQSKPEIPEITALDSDSGDDIIDGAQLPVGELARTADTRNTSAVDDAVRENAAEELSHALPPAKGQPPKKPRVKSGIKVPNFSKFRKKLILGIIAGVLLVAFLVWAIFFAARATVVITARTTESSANAKVTLGEKQATNFGKNTIKAAIQQEKKDVSHEFDATGKKEVGEKATGKMTITRTSVSSNSLTVPAGTSFTSGQITFKSTESATLSGTSIGENGIVQDSATVSVEAAEIGDEYNLSARSYKASVGGIDAEGTNMTGGSSKEVTVVSSNDVQDATNQLAQQNSDEVKKQLTGEFNDTFIVLDSTFKIDQGDPKSSPAVDQEVSGSGKAKLTATITYSIAAVSRADADNFLTDYFEKQIDGQDDRRIYDNGSGEVTFTNILASGEDYTANIVSTAKIGPKIDDNEVKDLAKGKRYGEIQSSLEAIQGIDDVDIKFWPFWVSVAPNDPEKITVEFNLNESE
jgi:hypothetical protein